VLDFILNFPSHHRWRFTDVLRNLLKIVVSLGGQFPFLFATLQPFSVAPKGIKNLLTWFPQVKGIPALYMMAVAVYLLPSIPAASALCVFPSLTENTNCHVIRFLLWWSQ
ncbi:hypothetical protein MKX03_037517, partial [Papaver bracteatum]